MNSSVILKELDECLEKLKMKLMFYETEIKELKTTIEKLKKFVKDVWGNQLNKTNTFIEDYYSLYLYLVYKVLNINNEEIWELLFYKISKLEKLMNVIIRDLDNNKKVGCGCGCCCENENKSK